MSQSTKQAFAAYKKSHSAWTEEQWKTENWQLETPENTKKMLVWMNKSDLCRIPSHRGATDIWDQTVSRDVNGGVFVGEHVIQSKCFREVPLTLTRRQVVWDIASQPLWHCYLTKEGYKCESRKDIINDSNREQLFI